MNFHNRPFRLTKKWSGALRICFFLFALLLQGRGMSAAAFPTNAVDTMFNAYSNAFYAKHGSNAWFKFDRSGGVADFWEQAEEIECIIDAYEWTSNANYRVVTAHLLNGFQREHGTNWASNFYNDDCMWASIAFARGYLITGDARYKNIARWNFNMVYDRAWDTNLGGGLYWTTTNRSKNACVNGPGGIAACLLFQIDGDESFRTKAREIFDWERKVLFNPETGAVSDSISRHGRVHSWTSTYNQGTFIGLADFLGRTNDAILAANYTRDHLTESGILTQYGIAGNNSGFNAIFLRWMSRLMRERGLQKTYESWLRDNADAAWNVRRTTDNLSWSQWREPTPLDADLRSWDCISSLEALFAISQLPNAATSKPGD